MFSPTCPSSCMYSILFTAVVISKDIPAYKLSKSQLAIIL